MKPVLYTIGNFSVYSFGFFLALSFIFSTFIIWKYAKDEFKEEEYLDAYLYGSIITLIAARAIYILRNFSDFSTNILTYILVSQTPGLSLLGGFLVGILFLYWYCRQKKIKFSHFMDIASIAFSLALFFIKIGQQLGGAAFGRETAFFLKIRIVGLPNFHHPAELYEGIIFLILFILLMVLFRFQNRRKLPEGLVFNVFTIATVLIIFSLEFLKVYRVYLYGLSFRQVLSLMVFLAALIPLSGKLKVIKNSFKQ